VNVWPFKELKAKGKMALGESLAVEESQERQRNETVTPTKGHFRGRMDGRIDEILPDYTTSHPRTQYTTFVVTAIRTSKFA
jgi:hypothetical protein